MMKTKPRRMRVGRGQKQDSSVAFEKQKKNIEKWKRMWRDDGRARAGKTINQAIIYACIVHSLTRELYIFNVYDDFPRDGIKRSYIFGLFLCSCSCDIKKKEKIRVLFPFGTIKYPLLRLMTRHKNNNRGNNWKQTWKVSFFLFVFPENRRHKKEKLKFFYVSVLITHSGKVFIFVNFDSELKFDFSSWRTRRSTERNFQRMRHTAGKIERKTDFYMLQTWSCHFHSKTEAQASLNNFSFFFFHFFSPSTCHRCCRNSTKSHKASKKFSSPNPANTENVDIVWVFDASLHSSSFLESNKEVKENVKNLIVSMSRHYRNFFHSTYIRWKWGMFPPF